MSVSVVVVAAAAEDDLRDLRPAAVVVVVHLPEEQGPEARNLPLYLCLAKPANKNA